MSTYTTTLTDTFVRYALDTHPSPGDVIVADLDDTLARYCKTRRLPGCHDFDPMPLLPHLLSAQAEGTEIVIASARPEWCYGRTRQWLQKYKLTPTSIYLKNRRCSLPAHDLKKKMLEDIMSNHRIACFYDDAMTTCFTAMAMGVNTIWVPGNESYWEEKAKKEGWYLPEDWFAMLTKSDCHESTRVG